MNKYFLFASKKSYSRRFFFITKTVREEIIKFSQRLEIRSITRSSRITLLGTPPKITQPRLHNQKILIRLTIYKIFS